VIFEFTPNPKMPKKLEQMSPEELGQLFPIILTEPDPAWPAIYRDEAGRIREKLPAGYLADIQHIGSTAVPGLISKPTIDILVEVHEDTVSETIITCLTALGYIYIPKAENPPPHMLFVKGYTAQGFRGQAFHLHVRYPGDWDEPLFRDYLKAHPESRKAYEQLKFKLSVTYQNDRDGYTEAKTDFIQNIMQHARMI